MRVHNVACVARDVRALHRLGCRRPPCLEVFIGLFAQHQHINAVTTELGAVPLPGTRVYGVYPYALELQCV